MDSMDIKLELPAALYRLKTGDPESFEVLAAHLEQCRASNTSSALLNAQSDNFRGCAASAGAALAYEQLIRDFAQARDTANQIRATQRNSGAARR